MSEINEYREGERIAELAVKDKVGRKQLDNIATYAYSRTMYATRFFIRKQASRGYISVNFMKELEALLGKTTSQTFSKMMRIAHDYYLWKENESSAETLYQHLKDVENIIQNYSLRLRLGGASASILIDKGQLLLQVAFDKHVPDKGGVARDLTNEIKNRIPELKPLDFRIWIKT